jgi:hypothetical protein
MKVELNKTYSFDLTGKVQFGDMPAEQLHKLFQDGRVASKFLEHTIPTWFPDLVFEDGVGYDHKATSTGRRYDLKGFTKGGACYAPSNMLGAGRKINEAEVHAHANEIDYIFSDITEFPKVRIIFKSGADMVEQWPSTKIPKADKEKLFG